MSSSCFYLVETADLFVMVTFEAFYFGVSHLWERYAPRWEFYSYHCNVNDGADLQITSSPGLGLVVFPFSNHPILLFDQSYNTSFLTGHSDKIMFINRTFTGFGRFSRITNHSKSYVVVYKNCKSIAIGIPV